MASRARCMNLADAWKSTVLVFTLINDFPQMKNKYAIP